VILTYLIYHFNKNKGQDVVKSELARVSFLNLFTVSLDYVALGLYMYLLLGGGSNTESIFFIGGGSIGVHVCLLSQVYLRFKNLAFLGRDQNRNRGSSVNLPTDNGKADEGPKDDIDLQQKPRKMPNVISEETNSKTAA
jgi:hypothetical protein